MEMKKWALMETWDWVGQKIEKNSFNSMAAGIACQTPETYIYDIDQGHVGIRELPNAELNEAYPDAIGRAFAYRDWLQEVVSSRCRDISTSIVMCVGDGAINSRYIPCFSFQKKKGEKSILFPDIDLLSTNFYHDPDNVNFKDKSNSAIFTGSTTGCHITLDRLNEGSVERIEAFKYFRHSRDVFFRLPKIVQYDGQFVFDALRCLGIGLDDPVKWDEAFGHKFILSMDGNGATCFRVYNTLRSNSVLIKYRSDSILYYFPHLIPYVHYLPAEDFGSVEDIIYKSSCSPDLFNGIAGEANDFCRKYMSRESALDYTHEVISIYKDILI